MHAGGHVHVSPIILLGALVCAICAPNFGERLGGFLGGYHATSNYSHRPKLSDSLKGVFFSRHTISVLV